MYNFIKYTASFIFFGIPQSWIIVFILKGERIPFDWTYVVTDGGLFFCATTLMLISFLQHFKSLQNPKSEAFFWAVIMSILVAVGGSITYCTGVVKIDGDKFVLALKPWHLLVEVACIFAAFTYGYIVEHRLTEAR